MERKIRPALWISIAALGIMSLIQLVIGVQRGSEVLFVAVVLNLVLLAGLLYGRKWAYVATLVFAVSGLVVALGRNAEQAMAVLVGNGLVIVPMIISTRFFFPGRPCDSVAEKTEMERS